MASIIFHFSSSRTASFLIAGVPAAARAIFEASKAQKAGLSLDHIAITAEGGWQPSPYCLAEIARLAPDVTVLAADNAAPDIILLQGEDIHSCAEILSQAASLSDGRQAGDITIEGMIREARAASGDLSQDHLLTQMKAQGRAIILATGKPSDGIVSTYINRPISRAISRMLLPIEGIKPVHATVAAGVVGVIMAACLLFGGAFGLLAGAALFQIASIIDGVDGEIARATHRTSLAGAKLDSLTDAATNLAFIGGVSVNLFLRGMNNAAAAGLICLLFIATGTALLGQRAKAKGGKFTFDEVKNHVRQKPSPVMQVLTWITMRDFYAAAAALSILLGYVQQALTISAVISGAWLIFTLWVLRKTARSDR